MISLPDPTSRNSKPLRPGRSLPSPGPSAAGILCRVWGQAGTHMRKFGGNRWGVRSMGIPQPIGSMYGIYANIWGILMVNVTIYSIHGSYRQ